MGCHRSMEEISNWILLSNDEKRQVLKNAEERSKTPIKGTNDYDYYV